MGKKHEVERPLSSTILDLKHHLATIIGELSDSSKITFLDLVGEGSPMKASVFNALLIYLVMVIQQDPFSGI